MLYLAQVRGYTCTVNGLEEMANGAIAALTFIVTPCQNQTLCHTLFYGRGRNRPSDILFLRGTIFSSTRRARNRLFVLWKCQKHRLFCNFIFGACWIFRSTPFSCTRRAADRPPPHKPYAGILLPDSCQGSGWGGGVVGVSQFHGAQAAQPTKPVE